MLIKNYKVISDIKEIKHDNNIDYQIYRRPLFHGTTMKVLTATNGEIVKLQETCIDICNILIPIFKEKMTEKTFSKYLYSRDGENLGEELDVFGDPMFQHKDLYLTTSYTKATNYSKNKTFGELGYFVKRLIKTKERFNLCEDNDYLDACINYYKKEITEYEKSKSVILIFKNINFSKLLDEDGNEIFNEQTKIRKIERLYKKPDDCFRLNDDVFSYSIKAIQID